MYSSLIHIHLRFFPDYLILLLNHFGIYHIGFWNHLIVYHIEKFHSDLRYFLFGLNLVLIAHIMYDQ